MNRLSRMRRSKRRYFNKSFKCDKWSIVHTNIRGYDSKAFSLHTICERADVLTINETFLKNNRKLIIPGFTCYNRNRKNVNGGGIATCIKRKDSMNTLKVFEGSNDDEILITRHGQFANPINVMNIYGSQECRSGREKIQDNWGIILQEVSKIEAKGELILLIGDFNKHVGDVIKGNESDKVSFGGQLVRDFLENGKYVLVNATKKVIGGPFTRFDPADPNNVDKKSVLSFCIVSQELFQFVDSLTIEKDKRFTPFRTISKNMVTFTDHYAMVLLFKNIPLKSSMTVGDQKVSRWNTRKEGGWDNYKRMTSSNTKLEKIANDKSEDPDKIMKKIDNELDKVRYQAFGKVKEHTKPVINKELDTLHKAKKDIIESNGIYLEDEVKKIDEDIAETLLKIQRETFEKELKDIKELKNAKGKSAAIFKVKGKIVGPKASAQEATILTDPKTGAEVSTPDDIKRVSLQYCKDLLTNREPKEEFIEDVLLKELVHCARMSESIENDIEELSIERFNETFKKLTKRPGSKYDFIVKGGQALEAALFKLCQVVWRKEVQPDRWCKSTLIQLYKGKGERNILDNMRHIHSKDQFPKFFGDLVVSTCKDKMTSNMTKFQIGTKPGHRAQEHLYVLKSVIAMHMQYGNAIVLSMWDVSKFFDRESLADCMNELYKNKIRGKLYRLLFNMNKNTRIRVQTPVGLTEECDTGEGVGQGTLEGALVSAVNLDSGVNDFFCDSEYEVNYGDVALQPILFQDDVARLSTSLESVQMGNNKMESLAETKLLNFNLDKSCFVVIGNEKSRRMIHDQLLDNPLILCGKEMKQEIKAKYLGDWLSSEGLSDSVAATVKKRKGLVVQSIYEIRAVIEDCRSQVCGGLAAGLDIWEAAVLPMLLYNSDCWMEASPQTIQDLENLQKDFYRCLFAVGSGCPIPSLYWETGGIMMKYRILKKKLLLLHHLATLPSDSLAREIYEVQEKLALPGLVKECQEYLVLWGITDITDFTSTEWKKNIRDKIDILNNDDIVEQTKSYKKISHAEFANQKCKRQEYISTLNIAEARLRFKINAKMTPTVQMNFQSDPQFASQFWTCSGCAVGNMAKEVVGCRDTQQHVLICPGYAEFREGKNLDVDKDLVQYFAKVLKLRQDKNDV